MKLRYLCLVLLCVCTAGMSARAAGPQEKNEGTVEEKVRKVFDVWSTALTEGKKDVYLNTFWDSPELVIRVSNGEWRGFDAYRQRIEKATLPPGNPASYKNVKVVALGNDGAVVTYERPAPQMGADSANIIFRGTVVFKKTAAGWKIAAWQADSVTLK